MHMKVETFANFFSKDNNAFEIESLWYDAMLTYRNQREEFDGEIHNNF